MQRLQRRNLPWLHCPAAVRPCCCAPCLTRAYIKNVGRHLLHWSRLGPESMETVCVCEGSGYSAMPTVTSQTTKLVLLSHFTAHCVLFFYWEMCNIMRGRNGEPIRGEVQELKLPKWELTEQSCCMSHKKNPIPSCNMICFYFHYLHVKEQHTKAVRLRPLSAVHQPLKWDSGIDFSFFVPMFSSWTAPGLFVVFS